MSRVDFTPADTTVIGVAASTVRSADSSGDSAKPRCTPPRPPVANTRIPALAARGGGAATVGPAVRRRAIASPRSRTLTLMTDSSRAIRSKSGPSRPTLGTPSITAIVAAVTPASVSISSNDLAAARLAGRGRPCEMIVDSRATTGQPAARAARTAVDTSGTVDMNPTIPVRAGDGREGWWHAQPAAYGAEEHTRHRRPSRALPLKRRADKRSE